jgi:hypothetical protein
MPDKNLIKLKKETYLKMIKNSPGTKIFNSLIVKNIETGQIIDILEGGIYSGAFFVSGILYFIGLLRQPHSTVTTLTERMIEEGFTRVGEEDYKPGDILIYDEEIFEDKTKSDQAGFYVGEEKAVSTSYKEKMVVEHHYTFGDKGDEPSRRIVEAFRPNYNEEEIIFSKERS